MIDVTHDGHHRRPRTLVRVLFFVFFLEVARQQFGFLLLAGVDQADVGADLRREELDHVVGQRLRRHDHLALEHQEADDVTGAAVQLGPEIARRRAAFDDDLAVGHRRRRRLIAGELCRLELLEVAPATAGASLRRAPSGQSAAAGGGWATRGPSASGASAESSATATGPAAEAAAAGATGTTGGTAGAGRGAASGAGGVAAPAGSRRRSGRAPATHTGRRRDRTATGPDRGPWGRWRWNGLAARAQRRSWGALLGRRRLGGRGGGSLLPRALLPPGRCVAAWRRAGRREGRRPEHPGQRHCRERYRVTVRRRAWASCRSGRLSRR